MEDNYRRTPFNTINKPPKNFELNPDYFGKIVQKNIFQNPNDYNEKETYQNLENNEEKYRNKRGNDKRLLNRLNNFSQIYLNVNDIRDKSISYNNNYMNNINNNNNFINNNYRGRNYGTPMKINTLFKNEVNTYHASAIPESHIVRLYNSIVKIVKYDGEATGFFMKIKLNGKEMRCLFTCFHVISDEDIQNEISIEIYYGQKYAESHRIIKLNRYFRFMQAYKDEDVAFIEIVYEDNISENKYLIADLNYKYGYRIYQNKNFYLAGYPENHNERCISSGKIIKINGYKFIHKLDTRPGSSGSPIVNDYLDVIGIHTSGYKLLSQNQGTFIGKILDNLKLLPVFSINYINNYNNYSPYDLPIYHNDNYNNYINNNANNYSKNNYFMLDRNENINNISFNNENENFIIGEIYINEELNNKKLEIIGYLPKDIQENCIITIDGEHIPFSQEWRFNKIGKHIIKYSFKDFLSETYRLFSSCSSLVSLDLSNFNTKNVTDMQSMFDECNSLKSLNLSNFNTINVTNMSSMFFQCRSLQNLDLSNFNTNNVKDMSFMFNGCISLVSLDLSNFNTVNVTNMRYMFFRCQSLQSLDLSNFNTNNVKEMSGIFKECYSLKELSQVKINKNENKLLINNFKFRI